jgi:hypothetical protein
VFGSHEKCGKEFAHVASAYAFIPSENQDLPIMLML